MVKKVKSLFMLERTLNCPASLQASHLNDLISLPIFMIILLIIHVGHSFSEREITIYGVLVRRLGG